MRRRFGGGLHHFMTILLQFSTSTHETFHNLGLYCMHKTVVQIVDFLLAFLHRMYVYFLFML